MTGAAYLARLSAIYAELDAKLSLRPGGTAAQIVALENKCGIRVPVQLRAIWREANGSKADRCVFARPGYLTGYGLLSVREAIRERKAMRRRAPQYAGYVEPEGRDRRIREGWFQPGWLPFAPSFDRFLALSIAAIDAEAEEMIT